MIRIFLACALLLGGCGFGSGPSLQNGSAVNNLQIMRAAVGEKSREKRLSPLSVVWMFSDGDLIACEPPTSVLRALRTRLGDRVDVSAVYVGDERAEFAQGFLRSERLDVPVRQIGHREYRLRFADRKLPIVVADNGTRRTIFDQETWRLHSRGSGRDLEAGVLQLVPTTP